MDDSIIADVIGRFFRKPDPPGLLIDVGVGNGREAWVLKAQWPGMAVIGIEPNSNLVRAAKLAGYPGEIIPRGVWSTPVEQVLRWEPDCPQGGTVMGMRGDVFYSDYSEREDVILQPLDKLMHEKGQLPPGCQTILWADVEGAELEMLRGAWALLGAGWITLLNLEVRQKPLHAGACSEAEVDAFLAAFGYARALTYNRHVGDDPHWDAVYVRHDRRRTW